MNELEKVISDLGNPKKYVSVESVEDYFAKPIRERTKWGFWYLPPNYLPWMDSEEHEKDGGWGEFYAKIKKQYPIQYFLREVIWNNIDIKWYRVKNKFENWYIWAFKPQHNELRAVIPRNWADLDSILSDFLYACIISFVEKENGLGNYYQLKEDKIMVDKLKSRKISKKERAEIKKDIENKWGGTKYFNNYYDAKFNNYEKINEIYNYAKYLRPLYLKFLNNAEDYITPNGERLSWSKVEKLSDLNDDVYLPEIVKLRKNLWT